MADGPEISVEASARQSRRFLILYALAWSGSVLAYVPFLTILLPVKVSLLAGADNKVWLAYIAFGGAVAASIGNIGFGWLSDLTKNRRGWIALGLVLSCALLLAVPRVTHFWPLLILILLWQLALNMMLAPLAAWAGDCVPHHQKGILAGLLAFAPAIGASSGALVTIPGLADVGGRFGLVALMVAACVLPVLLFGRPKAFPDLMTSDRPVTSVRETLFRDTDPTLVRLWLARLLVQIAEAALFTFLYIWLRTLDEGLTDNDVARLFSLVLAGSIPIAFLAGRWCDRNGRPTVPLILFTGLSAAGLVVMGGATTLTPGVAGYFLFGLASSAFLSLHSAQTLRFLTCPARRARDLGLFNLTNTFPSFVMPWLVILTERLFGFSAIFFLLAGLAVVAAILLLSIPRQR